MHTLGPQRLPWGGVSDPLCQACAQCLHYSDPECFSPGVEQGRSTVRRSATCSFSETSEDGPVGGRRTVAVDGEAAALGGFTGNPGAFFFFAIILQVCQVLQIWQNLAIFLAFCRFFPPNLCWETILHPGPDFLGDHIFH